MAQPNGFDVDRLRRIAAMERSHFWFVGRRVLIERLMAKYLGRRTARILDVGCGTGLMLERLMDRGHRVMGLDLRREGLGAVKQSQPGAWVAQASAACLPVGSRTFDGVLMLDLLEHVDDRKATRELCRVLKPGATALISVPALPWLWSYRDEAAGHRRRYTRAHLTQVLTDARLQILELGYYQFLLIPIIALTRLAARRRPGVTDLEERQLPVLNRLLTWLIILEVRAGEWVKWPWGSSLIAVCRKVEAEVADEAGNGG